jgi:hypothetical protein
LISFQAAFRQSLPHGSNWSAFGCAQHEARLVRVGIHSPARESVSVKVMIYGMWFAVLKALGLPLPGTGVVINQVEKRHLAERQVPFFGVFNVLVGCYRRAQTTHHPMNPASASRRDTCSNRCD